MTTNITDQLRHLEDLAAMCEPGFGMGSEPFRQAREEIERLRVLLKQCSDELEEEIDARYDAMLAYPNYQRKHENDMATVKAARAALATHTSNADSGSLAD